MRIMGLDFGSKTVGVAVSDSLLVTAQGLEIIRREKEEKLRRTLARIEELIVEYEVEEIVLGLPKNMNATEGERVELTAQFRAAGHYVGRASDHRGGGQGYDRGGHPQGKAQRLCGQDSGGPDAAGLSGQPRTKGERGRGRPGSGRGRFVGFFARRDFGIRRPGRGADALGSEWGSRCLRLRAARHKTETKDRLGADMAKLEKIMFHPEGEEPVEFYVLEQTRIGGVDYILVTDVEEGDGEALIMKDISGDGEEEGVFTIVSDDEELAAVAGMFENMLEDGEFENA